MTSFFALLRLQLLSRYADLKPKNLKARFQEKKARTIGAAIAIVIAIVYLGGALIFVENALLDILIKMGIPDLLITMAVMLSMAGTLIMSFFFIMSSLYFGRDAMVLSAMPVKSRTILSAKLCQVWISEVGFSLLFILPPVILYSIKVGADALFFVRAIIAALLAPVLPIVIIAFISTLLIRLSALWKRRDLIVTVLGIGFMVAYMFLAMNIGSLTGSGEANDVLTQFMASNSARIQSMTRLFPPAAWGAEGIMGQWGKLALLFAVCALGAAAAVWIIGFWYQRLSLLQGETPVETRKKGAVRASFSSGSAFRANCVREIRQILRVPSYATNILPISFMPLLMVVLMYVAFGNAMDKNGESIETLLSTVNTDLALPILAAVLCYMAGMNPALSTAITREGKGHDFMNALPVSPRTLVLSKLAVGYGLSVIGVLLAAAVLTVLFPALALHAFLAAVLCLLFTYFTACITLIRDLKHPRLDWVTEQEAVKQNYGVLIGMLVGWGLLVALAGLTYLLFQLKVSMLVYFLIVAGLLCAVCLIMHQRLMKTADRYYCQG